MDIVKICGAALLCALVAAILKKLGSPTWCAAAVVGVIGAALFVLPKIKGIVDSVGTMASGTPVAEKFPIVLKVCAAAVLTEICADVCAATGEHDLSKSLSAAGKIEMIYLSLPLIKELFDCASSLASGK